MPTNLNKLIAPVFYKLHHQIKNHEYTHYWLRGGRGSTKSSVISIEIIIGMMKNPEYNAIAFRKVGHYLKESVFEQLIWAIDKLNVADFWRINLSPLGLTYKPTGQRIIFRGCDDPKKTKSVKLRKGYFAYCWYEELDEFTDMNEIDTLNQSILRGGNKFWVFYSFNPPKSKNAWVNYEATNPRIDKIVHTSCYLDVPKQWLGEQFLIEAETCREQNYKKYLHQFIGKAIGTGGNVFENVEEKIITDEMIDSFKIVRHGVDFGFSIDPLAYIAGSFDSKYHDLYLFDEIYEQKLMDREACDRIKTKVDKFQGYVLKADSAEPKTITTYRRYGLNIFGAKKSRDSVNYGIKWLQGLNHIYIDRRRCPNTYRELINYEYERNKDGEFISAYPDKSNHALDAIRYAFEADMPAKNKITPIRVNY